MFRSPLTRYGRVLVISGSAIAVACSTNTPTLTNSIGGATSAGGAQNLSGSGGGVVSPGGGTGGVAGAGGGTNVAIGGTLAVAGASGMGGASAMGGSSATMTGGAKNLGVTASSMGGASSASVGGTSNSGGSSTVNTGGTRAMGGSAAAGGTKSTGGTSATLSSGGASSTGGRTVSSGSSTIPTGLPSTCGATNCDNATPVNPQLTSYGALGNVTEYSTAVSKGGACLYGDTSILYYAAIAVNLSPGDGKGQWQGGTICGQCFEVTVVTSQGPKSVVIRVTDKCPDGQCGMDLGGSAPSSVMVDGFGRYQGAWRAVSCAGHPEVSDGVPSIHVKDGSNPGWSAIQVRNPVMGVAGIDYQDTMNGAIKGSIPLSNGIENYYQVPTDVLASFSTIDITVRYVDGSTAKAAITATQLATANGTYPLN